MVERDRPPGWTVEPCQSEIVAGTTTDLVVKLVEHRDGYNIVKTQIHGDIYTTDANVSAEGWNTVFRVKVCDNKHLAKTWETFVIDHSQQGTPDFCTAAELCSGIGAVTTGYARCGVHTELYVEQNANFAQWLRTHKKNVIEGDICSMDTVMRMANKGIDVINAGISCQPFSRLGDRREEKDERSKSLIGVLQAIHLLQIRIATLECTPAAKESKWVQDCLRDFSCAKKMDVQQILLDISDIWPAKRNRWWCTITTPEIQMPPLKPIPTLGTGESKFRPALIHLMPKYLVLPPQELRQLRLDLYELRHFHSRPSLDKHLIDQTKPLPTATHSWGSQVKGCACGCRNSGFSEGRLDEKGLYGQVMMIGGTEVNGTNTYNSCRHLHPAEVALINGLCPSFVGQGDANLRLELAAVGQLASPFQGAWIMAQVAEAVRTSGHQHPSPSPQEVLFQQAMMLFEERDRMLKMKVSNTFTDLFFQAWQDMRPDIDEKVASPLPEDVPLPFVFGRPFDFGTDEQVTTVDTGMEPRDAVEATPSAAPEPVESFADMLTKVSQARQRPASDHAHSSRSPMSLPPDANTHDLGPASTDEHTPNMHTCSSRVVLQPPSEMGGFFASTEPATEATAPLNQAIEVGTSQEMDEALTEFQDPEVEIMEPLSKRPRTQAIDARAQVTQESVAHVIMEGDEIQTISYGPNTTVKQLVDAQLALHQVTDLQAKTAMGNNVEEQQPLMPGQFITIVPPTEGTQVDPPELHQDWRGNLLWAQQGWVAYDEMWHYTQFVEHSYPSSMMTPILIEHRPDASTEITKAILRTIHRASTDVNSSIKAFVMLYRSHWYPFAIRHQEGHITITTATDFVSELDCMLKETLGEHTYNIKGMDVPSVFHADCGFQALGWILAMLQDDENPLQFSDQQACQWRALAHQHMHYSGEANQFVYQPIVLGGASSIQEDLQKLLVSHGVAQQRSASCAEQLVQSLGTSSIQAILKSPRPWADLKARANLLKPPVRIVQPEELKHVIQNRLKENKPIGRKANKMKHKQITTPVIPKAEQLAIPPGVFCQDDGQELTQILPQQLGQGSKGVVLVDYADAMPYFELRQPLTQEGLALLVLNHDMQELPAHSTIAKIPAHCKATAEPVIVTVGVVQIGAKTVTRNVPKQVIEVQQVENSVVRILLYRDQYVHEWEQVVAGPVKEVLHSSPLAQALKQIEVLDVWDRQFLSERMTKALPRDAFVFSVNLRVANQVLPQLTQLNGLDGIYIEPRSADGRHPSSEFEVCWQPRKTFAEITLQQKVTQVPTTVVRLGQRYGLRAKVEHAETLHNELRPDTVYLQGTELRRFRVGPFPFGSTKMSLAAVFKQWQWPARALAPIGQTPDRAGMMWSVQASAVPKFWVWQLAHGDVLIAAEGEASSSVPVSTTLVASNRTMQTLQTSSSSQSSRPEDPWQKPNGPDPWQQPRTGGKELSTGQIAALEATLESKLMKKLKSEDDDMQTQADRLGDLEAKMEQLTHALSEVQQSQAQETQIFQSQIEAQAQQAHHVQKQLESHSTHIQQLDHKIDQQLRATQNMFDSKLDSHIQRIEALFNQRGPRE
eukprot:Skav215028  [mRNA]  locus=scaffold966:519649:524391:- [translate_table: standard]